MPKVLLAHPQPCPGFSRLTLNHAYRNPYALHSHTWFLAYHKSTLQSGLWLTTNLQSGFKITTNFMGVHIPHQAYITHSNSWSYQVHTLQRPLQNILDLFTNKCMWHILHDHESILQTHTNFQLVVHHPLISDATPLMPSSMSCLHHILQIFVLLEWPVATHS